MHGESLYNSNMIVTCLGKAKIQGEYNRTVWDQQNIPAPVVQSLE